MSHAADTYPTPEHGWVCYHCGEHFPGTFEGGRRAREHFGWKPDSIAACLIKGEDNGLLRRLRATEDSLRDVSAPRPLSEWHEDIGSVIWWRFPIDEPPYIGTPLDLGHAVELEIRRFNQEPIIQRVYVGGWPGYHTHWTPLTIPNTPPVSRETADAGGEL